VVGALTQSASPFLEQPITGLPQHSLGLVRHRSLIRLDTHGTVTRLPAARVKAPNPDNDTSVPDPLPACIGQAPHHW
jgi:hypothetical protein